MQVEEESVKVVLRREDELLRLWWIVGANLIATMLRRFWHTYLEIIQDFKQRCLF